MESLASRLTRNPFQNRMAVVEPNEFFGRRQQITSIYQLLSHPNPLSASVFGARRTGKSSLLNYLMKPEAAFQEFPRCDVELKERFFVRMDLASFEFDDADEKSLPSLFFASLFHELRQTVLRWQADKKTHLPEELEDLFRQSQSIINANRLLNLFIQPYLELLAASTRLPVVLLLDEADKLLQFKVGYPLRALITNPATQVSVILFTNWRIVDLDPEGALSPINNLLSEIPLGLWTDEETLDFIQTSAAQAGRSFSPMVVDWIARQGGRHPDFTKIIARHVFDADPGIITGEDFLANLLPEITFELEPACRSLWGSIEKFRGVMPGDTPVTEVIEKALRSGGLKRSSAPGSAGSLLNRGILIPQGDELRIFSPIFENYLRRQLVLESSVEKMSVSQLSSPLAETLLIEGDLLKFGPVSMPLTKREAALLRYMNQNPGQPCSREALYTHIWGGHFDPNLNSATVNIVVQRLREKLEAYQLDERIQLPSERNMGYRLTVR